MSKLTNCFGYGRQEVTKEPPKCTVKYSSGDVYTGSLLSPGSLLKGKRHGYGVLTSSKNELYEGLWKNDKKHGFGCFKYANGEVYKGNW